MANPKSPKRINSVNVRMSDETLSKLRAIAEKDKRTVSNLIDKIVSDWVEEWERKSVKKGE
jgi:predicted transcriptional regulator